MHEMAASSWYVTHVFVLFFPRREMNLMSSEYYLIHMKEAVLDC